MAIIYKNFRWEKDGTDFFGKVKDKEFVGWSLTANPGTKPWKKGDKIIYGTNYAEVYDTKETTLTDLFNILFTKLSAGDVETVLDQDPWLKEPFMMFIANPFCNKEFKDKLQKIADDAADASSSASYASTMASLSHLNNLF